MFWIAVEPSNQRMGLITRLTCLVKNLTSFKFVEVAKVGNTGGWVANAMQVLPWRTFTLPFTAVVTASRSDTVSRLS